MPRAVDVLQVTHHHSVAWHALVDDGATAGSARAQRTALMRAIVRDGVERPVDVVDADTVPSDGHQFVCAGRDLVHRGDDVLTPLRQPGRFLLFAQFRTPAPGPRGPEPSLAGDRSRCRS